MTSLTPCLRFDGTAEDAASFYAATFTQSRRRAFQAMTTMSKIDIAQPEDAPAGTSQLKAARAGTSVL